MEAKETIKIKLGQAKWRAQAKARKALNWIEENKEVVVTVAPICIAVGGAGIKALNKHVNLKKQADLKDLYCYDNRLGHYWRLRRPLTNHEWLEIDQRKRNGEPLADILAELRVLK